MVGWSTEFQIFPKSADVIAILFASLNEDLLRVLTRGMRKKSHSAENKIRHLNTDYFHSCHSAMEKFINHVGRL